MGQLYICCRCNDGPKLYENQPQCVMCNHPACQSCVDVNSAARATLLARASDREMKKGHPQDSVPPSQRTLTKDQLVPEISPVRGESRSAAPFHPVPTDHEGIRPVEASRPSSNSLPSNIAFTDSGYGSSIGGASRQAKAFPSANHQENVLGEEAFPTTEGQKDQNAEGAEKRKDASDINMDEISSVYSDVSSIAVPTRDGYLQALADELFNEISSYEPDADMVNRILQALPGLIKTFALSIGHNASSQMQRDVMVFTHKYRQDLVKIMKEKLSDYACNDGNDRDSDKMPPSERIVEWLSQIQIDDQEVDADGISTPDGTPESEFPMSLSEVEDEEDQDTKIFPGIEAYTKMIRSSAGYNSLLANIHRVCLLCPTEPNTMEEIRNSILRSLAPSPIISRRRSTETFHMKYIMDWDFFAFCREQEYEVAPDVVLEKAISLTGSPTHAQALTCGEYVRQTWPVVGPCVLDLVKKVTGIGTKEKSSATLPDGSKMEIEYPRSHTSSSFRATVKGPAHSIAEIGQILAWLGAALQSSSHTQGVVYRKPMIVQFLSTSNERAYGCILSFMSDHDVQKAGDVNGKCWYNLFRNPVVVKGYPISRRHVTTIGIEMPLEMMAQLVQTKYLNPFADRFILKGYSMMVVPTAYSDNTVTWHLLYNQDGEYLSYTESETLPKIDINIPKLITSRHVLGWCSEMKFYAGAPDACYQIKCSSLSRVGGTGLLASVSLSMGQLVTGGVSALIGKRDTPVHVSRNGFVRKLTWLSGKFVVLWDQEDKRGWLVNGTSALLHLVRGSLDQDKRDGLHKIMVFRDNHLQEAERRYSPHSALDVLSNPENLQLKVYPEGNGHTRLADDVEHFLDLLEKMIGYQNSAMERKSNVHLSREFLEGWDFHDLIKGRDPIYPRHATFDYQGRAWVDFTRSIRAVTLFGRGFGEIIKPLRICSQWDTLPKDLYYLAACREDLEEIMEGGGGDASSVPLKLTDNTIWLTPTESGGLCKCTKDVKNHSDLSQVLLPSHISDMASSNCFSMEKEEYGAFIFGYNTAFPWYWGDAGDPFMEQVKGKPGLSQDEATSPSDSGIGSSLSSFPSMTREPKDSILSETSIMGSPQSSPSPGPLSDTPLSGEQAPSRSTLSKSPALRYAVGIVCALPTELFAVRALFDSTHESIPIPNEDSNYYALGSISSHQVVAACLPHGEYGTNPAAEVASNMRRSFPNLKFCLLVGIGGGVPYKHDIRLGDVVVSSPSGSNCGIIPYDMKKALANGVSQPNGYLSPPPRHLRCALTEIQSDPSLSNTRYLEGYLQQIDNCNPDYQYPKSARDELFIPEFNHPQGLEKCNYCPPTKQVMRCSRTSTQPQIHYGLIASGNQVMKDAIERDNRAKQHDILCFEMEAAGIMHTIPSLVIRGICDYADSHKNKAWQKYAAATAAAYAKFLLSRVRPRQEGDP